MVTSFTKMTIRICFSVLCLVITVNCAIALECEGGNCSTSFPAAENGTKTNLLQPQEVSEHTSKPAERLKAMNMVHEEEQLLFRPTIPTFPSDEPKGRSLNFTIDENNHDNGLLLNSTRNGTKKKEIDLSDVDMDNDDNDDDIDFSNLHSDVFQDSKIQGPTMFPRNYSLEICEKGGLTYDNGERLEVGCDSICTCIHGKMDCVDRCSSPYFRKGKKIDDPLCIEQPADDHCCAILTCADTATEPLEICSYKNKTYNRGDKIRSDCVEVCSCDIGGKISCKPRCPPITQTSDRCVEIQDPKDICCKTVLCDVTLEEHETEKDPEMMHRHRIVGAKYLNQTTIKIEFENKFGATEVLPLVEVSANKINWTAFRLLPGDLVQGFKDPVKYVRFEAGDEAVEVQNYSFANTTGGNAKSCTFKGKSYSLDQEFNDACESLCICQETGVKCLKIDCPTYFGLDVVDPACIDWETVPPNFVPTPPHCCPDKLRCKSNGSCEYEGSTYPNWHEIPSNVTGCQRKCYCEMGKVECQNMCPPVPAVPPNDLPCPPHHAILSHLPDDDCCMYWVCEPNLPSGQHNLTADKTAVNEVDLKPAPDSKNQTDFSFFNPGKTPSRTLGPLQIYENAKNKFHLPKTPNISLEENHYYHKDEDPEYFGPFNPDHRSPIISLEDKPHSPVNPERNETNEQPHLEENFISGHNSYSPILNKPTPQNPNGIQIHGKGGTPEELLQLLNQHPDFSNYPPGSILEIHNIPQILPPDKTQYVDPNTIISPNNQHQLVPYIVNQPQTRPVPASLPPGFTFEHILQDINKKAFPQFPQTQFPQPNGLLPNGGHAFVPIYNAQPHRNMTQGIGFPGTFPGFQQPQDEVVINNLEAVDARSVRLSFTIPPVIVGLHGRVEVRYTHKINNDDPSSWDLQVFAPPNDLLATPQMEFELSDLRPDTEYKIKVTVTLRDLHNTPTSKVYTVKTFREAPSSTLPPMIPIEPDLAINDVNSTWVIASWRKFTEYELQFIDGVQLRYKEIDTKVYAATPLIHRAVTSYTLENLKPNTKYEIGIYFIPFSGQLTELHSEHMIHFTTANEVDNYGFNVSLDITMVKPTSVEITWNGVPYPEDKYVNIYRAIYQSDSGKGDSSTFKVAKRDSPSKTIIKDLKPGTRYRLWLEVYLTNGRIKTSNVQDFITKPRSVPVVEASHDKLSGDLSENRGDYYGPLVIVAILAAIAILSTLVLLLILVKRHNQNKASITTPPRVSQSAYDNPTYKVEIQQETMGIKM